MSSSEPTGALAGIRIVEACQGVGGPMAAMLLAEQGADVIKIEPPSGDALRGCPAFHVLNRSKRAAVLDLGSDHGRRALQDLLRDADVFLYDWPPGRDVARGFDAAALHAENPRLVTGYLPAYGSRGPWAHLPADEALVQAVSGAQAAQWRYDPRPVYINIPIAGYAQGIVGAGAVAAALYARARTGRGDRFELSAVAAIFQFETTAFVRSANVQRLAGQSDPRGPIPTYRLVRASDGWLFIGALTPAFWTKLAVACGLEDLLVDERFAGAPIAIPNMDDRKELAARLDAAFATKTREEWMRILEGADVPRSLVFTRDEWLHDEQLRHNGMVVEIDDPALGRTTQMGVPVRFRHSPGRIVGAAPLQRNIGDAASWVGAQPAAPAAEAARTLTARKFPLQGIRVLDLGTFIAGASCSMMLADYGADVIKIEGPDGDAWRGSGLGFLGSNRNKRGLCIDLRQEDGRETFLHMVEHSDVVLDNLRPGIMERLGIGYETLRERNPRIVHCSVTAYGPDGPRAHLPGFDPLMQAQGGIMRAQGDAGGEPVYLQIAVCDYATALTAAFGIIAALVARERTGLGDRVETCLANASLTVQAGEFIIYDGKPAEPPGGRDLAGRHALYRIYDTADGALMLACTSHEHARAVSDVARAWLEPPAAEALSAVPPPPHAPLPDGSPHALDGDLAQQLQKTFRSRDTRAWLDALLPRGVPVAPCVAVANMFEDEHLSANGLWWDTEHLQWGAIRQTGELIKWDTMSMALLRRAPLLGEHSVEVLREFGVAPARIEALVSSGVVTQAS